MAEIAMAMPLFLGLTLGVADGGRAFAYREAVTNAARQALRTAVLDSADGNLACASVSTPAQAVSKSGHVPSQTGDWAGLSSIATAAALEGSSNGTAAGSRISGATITVTWHCLSGSAIANAQNGGTTDPSSVSSDAIEVRISYGFTLLTPLVGRMMGSGTPQIAADVVGRAEY
ncbi:MAG TPA: TadE family protein [Candidatus Dormibacteraeota bacterium]|jgi:Flp pilus assembly protein TadG|nr:TadE family protein [Candidatus Dormibacteraeota bacterium]